MKRLASILLLAGVLANAQCVMCYRTAHAQNQARARILNLGILVLGVPPFLIFGGFFYYLLKRDRSL